MITNTKTLITVKTDKTLKAAAQEVAATLGIPLGTLINSFMRQFVRDKEVNFSISYKPTAYLRDVIARADKDYATGKFKVSHSIDELEKELRS